MRCFFDVVKKKKNLKGKEQIFDSINLEGDGCVRA